MILLMMMMVSRMVMMTMGLRHYCGSIIHFEHPLDRGDLTNISKHEPQNAKLKNSQKLTTDKLAGVLTLSLKRENKIDSDLVK